MKNLSLICCALFAQTLQASPGFTGFYATGAIGGTLLNLRSNQIITANVPGFIELNALADANLEGRSASGLIGLGYSHLFYQKFVFAGQLTAGFLNANVTHRDGVTIFSNSLSGKVETKLQNDFSLLFKPGYRLAQNTQIYGLIGPRWGYFKSSLNTNLVGNISVDDTSGYELGVTAGLGFDHLINDHLSLGLEYAYTHYGEISSSETQSVLTSIPIVNNSELKPSTNAFEIFLSYHF